MKHRKRGWAVLDKRGRIMYVTQSLAYKPVLSMFQVEAGMKRVEIEITWKTGKR